MRHYSIGEASMKRSAKKKNKFNKNNKKSGGVFSMLLEFLRGSKRYYFMTVAAVVINTLADMISPQIISFTIDYVIGDKPLQNEGLMNFFANALGGVEYIADRLWIPALCIVVAATVSTVSNYCYSVSHTKAAESTVKTMRDKIFGHIARLPLSWHSKNQTGDIIQRATSDVDVVKRFLSEQLVALFEIIVMIALSLYFMFSMNISLAIIAVITMPVIITYSALFHNIIGKRFETCDESESKLSAIVQENLTGVRVVRAFGRESYERDKFNAQNDLYCKMKLKLGAVFAGFWSSSDLISGLQVMLVVVFGALKCAKGEMTAGNYVAFISYNSMIVWPIRRLGRMISQLSKAGVSMKRIHDVLSAEVEHDAVGCVNAEMDKDIVFDHVSFGYDGCTEILTDVSFSIGAGQTLGILGGTGSGKSTLVALLDKLYDLPEGSGGITIGGVDIKEINTAWLRKNIGLVLQEPFLFSRTIRENIELASDELSLDEVKNAAKLACLDGAVEHFADGYDTFVGERGVTLSGGQKQRAAIARMLALKTPIMVFDDSLSAVDTETDAKIRASIEKNTAEATVILIAHRITTVMRADRIIVLDKGRIAEQGTHDELIAHGGIYAQIYAIQTNMGGESE